MNVIGGCVFEFMRLVCEIHPRSVCAITAASTRWRARRRTGQAAWTSCRRLLGRWRWERQRGAAAAISRANLSRELAMLGTFEVGKSGPV
jgi:hypothetical protein